MSDRRVLMMAVVSKLQVGDEVIGQLGRSPLAVPFIVDGPVKDRGRFSKQLEVSGRAIDADGLFVILREQP
ncbi:hypothetical protein ACN20G_29790 (plasmid) [Streptomyces sp. BI20]|uniref:hypothetical protein n=1 Tax=Streptomyces sp. BI20 TaxID=3403460 RepID=UPI003C720109